MTWKIRGRDVAPDDVAGYVGFVYVITHVATSRSYVGKKTLVSRRTRPPLKGKKRKRRDVVESDWRDYWGSSNELLADVAKYGEAAFERSIVHLCKSRGELSYMELMEQMTRDVLRRPQEFYNSFVGAKIHRSHVLKKS